MKQTFQKLVSGQSRGFLAGLLRACLWCLSKPYGAAITVRNWGYDRGFIRSQPAPIPVVSIGNLTVGGTGKTPAVAMLANWFRAHGLRVAILSRGYGRGDESINDEGKELEIRLPDVPHLQNPDRLASAVIAHEELDSQLVLLDDGFQHRRMRRDLEIVLLDALVPFGYGRLLPRGLLREPLSSLRRADVVFVTRADQVEASQLAEIRTRVQRWTPNAAWVETEHRPTCLRNVNGHSQDLEWLADKRIIAFCGIGNPKAFLVTLQKQNALVVDSIFFPDHHPYQQQDIDPIRLLIENQKELDGIICTGKDLPKIGLDELAGRPIWSLDIQMHVRFGQEALEDRLQSIVDQINQR